ncbi:MULTISPECIES: ABC transporter substrate-binding protein [Enterococcus]|nr:extracellular solute-binding protein [Enterococcus avium]HAP3020812.1 extracellular solute-binding protein [Enterococcus faecalis]AYQ24059.1 sugar ABC transporter substrate-binding protein [Enterococcus avium]HBI1561148.1 extracellular solute-binding protein [Enterococcus faecalis]HBI1564421.1 extracellular solute-binding protein [Enterococcus faecalis]HBI1716987.1 extracellular solute-binding protein [Enterococcus faecalis]
MKKKKLLSLLSLVAVVLSLAACGGGGKRAGSKNGNSNEKVSVEVWLTPQWKGVYSSNEAGADYDSFLKAAAEKYEKDHPNVDIKVQVIPSESRSDKLSVAIQTKTLPDIFFDSSFALSEYAHMGVIVPLDDIIDKDTKKDIPETIWNNVEIRGKTYFYPFSHNPGTLLYNAEMFKQAGLDKYIGGEKEITTWSQNDLTTIVTALKETFPEVAPFGLWAKNNQGDTWTMSYLRMEGNKFFGDDNKLVANEKDGVSALTYLNDLRKKGLTTSGPESLTSNDVNAMFQNKQVAISFTNAVLFSNIQNDMENGKVGKFDMRLANIPGKKQPISFTYVTSSVAFNTGNKAKMEVAKDFIKFYSTEKELVKASRNSLPVRTSVINELKSELPYLSAYEKNAQYIINFSNNVPGYSELRNALFPQIQAVYTDTSTPQKAMDEFVQQGNQILENNMKKSVIK